MTRNSAIEDAERRLQDSNTWTAAALEDYTQTHAQARQRLNELERELNARENA